MKEILITMTEFNKLAERHKDDPTFNALFGTWGDTTYVMCLDPKLNFHAEIKVI